MHHYRSNASLHEAAQRKSEDDGCKGEDETVDCMNLAREWKKDNNKVLCILNMNKGERGNKCTGEKSKGTFNREYRVRVRINLDLTVARV